MSRGAAAEILQARIFFRHSVLIRNQLRSAGLIFWHRPLSAASRLNDEERVGPKAREASPWA